MLSHIVFNINANTVIDNSISLCELYLVFNKEVVQSVVETEVTYVTRLAIHRKLHIFKTVLALDIFMKLDHRHFFL